MLYGHQSAIPFQIESHHCTLTCWEGFPNQVFFNRLVNLLETEENSLLTLHSNIARIFLQPTKKKFQQKKQLTGISPVNCIPITGEDQRCGLDRVLPHHASLLPVHLGTLHSVCALLVQVCETDFTTGRMEGDGPQSTNIILDENSSVCARGGGDLQAGLFGAAPVDVECYPVQRHGGDCVTHESENLAARGQDSVL